MFSYTAEQLIPSSVLSKNNYSDPFLALIAKDSLPSSISRIKPFSEEETNLIIKACVSNSKIVVDHTTLADVGHNDYVKPTVSKLAYISMHKLSAQRCRRDEWAVMSKYFKSFGLRDLPISRSPVSIYGSVNTTTVYPVALIGVGEDK